jgi:hypothetical protein
VYTGTGAVCKNPTHGIPVFNPNGKRQGGKRTAESASEFQAAAMSHEYWSVEACL